MAKKVAKKRKVAKKVVPVNALPAETCTTGCCSGGWLCGLSLIAAVFFIISVLPALGTWVMSVHWGIWLIVALVLGWKPLMKCMKK